MFETNKSSATVHLAALTVSQHSRSHRRFAEHKALEKYVKQCAELSKLFNATNPNHFKMLPIELLAVDKENLRILERVFMAPTALDIIDWKSRESKYWKVFERRMQNKGIAPEEAKKAVRLAYEEIVHKGIEIEDKRQEFLGRMDTSMSNILVLDIDKKTGIVTVAFPDFGGSIPE